MLIGLDNRLTPALLHTLAAMGHGDEIAIVDTHFPAMSTARQCVVRTPIELPGVNAAEAAEVITTLLPLDQFSDEPALRMEIDGAPDELGDVHRDVSLVLASRLPAHSDVFGISCHDFYKRAAQAYAIVICGETRPYGCFLLRKGVVM
jgi:L-fucose mutarotase